jgi:hypothetical protein
MRASNYQCPADPWLAGAVWLVAVSPSTLGETDGVEARVERDVILGQIA